MKKILFYFKKSYQSKKRIQAALMALFILLTPCYSFAAVLGNPTSTSTKQYAQGTTYTKSVFYDNQVGQQTEHYFTYVPNPDVTPVLTNGYSLYGKRTLTQANKILTEQGLNTAAGINADFFSFQTGVPMSNVIIDKEVISKDDGDLPAVGFREDGTAFMGKLPITTTITTSLGSTEIECINKYRQPYALYLFTDQFDAETHSEDKGIDIVLGSVKGNITLNSTVTAVVESITENEGSVPIPEGKLVLSVSDAAAQEIKDRLNILTEGSKVTITTKDTSGDNRWKEAVYALGGTGGKLITNGQLDLEDDAAAPRTAIGIKADGTIIFYTLDGRQSGYSYGARKETLAKRLLELGCTEAMNLDGGGSTSIGGVYPGTTDFKTLNSPSGGSLRSCANFFFLKKNVKPTGIPYILEISDWGKPVLSGSSIQLKVDLACDTSFGPASVPEKVTYTLEKDALTPSPDGLKTVVQEDGFVTVRGNGDVYISAKGDDATGSTMLRAVATPEQIKVFNTDTGEQLEELILEPGEIISLSSTAYWGGQEMIVESESFTWRVVSDGKTIGKIDNSGKFTAGDTTATGTIAVNAGLCTTEIPVKIQTEIIDNPNAVFPKIIGNMTSETFSATISYDEGKISREDIKLYVDNSPVTDFNYNSAKGSLTYEIPAFQKENYHRITVVATSPAGTSAIGTYNWKKPSLCENPFPDTTNHWAKDYISYMSGLGVVNGSSPSGDGNDLVFLPDNNMTRTEFAIMLCNYLGVDAEKYADTELPFTDLADIPWWALDKVKAIYSLGLMKGQLTDYGVEFKPNDNIKRMEYAISIQRYYRRDLPAVQLPPQTKAKSHSGQRKA